MKKEEEIKEKMNKDKWIWMPHAGHLCVGNYCRFHLNTKVREYIISTVGEYFRDGKMEEVGCERFYETMVFKAQKSKNKCCPYEITGSEFDMEGYNNAGDAYKGHLKLCKKWAIK